MLVSTDLFGATTDRVATAIERLKTFEDAAIAKHPDGYWLAFSGGKDSIVILDLAKRSGVKFTAHFNLTTVDPPELLRFVKQNYKGQVKLERPPTTMWKLIVKKMMPPTRIVRYCCEELKERGGAGMIVVTGIRWGESVKRSKRQMTEACFKDKSKLYLHPIIDWSTEEVWEYIKTNNLPYPSLYDEGFKRIGCVGCSMSGSKGMKKEFARWPKFERLYRKAFAAAAAAANIATLGVEYGGHNRDAKLRWPDGESMFSWWMQDQRNTKPEGQQTFFFGD